MLLLGEKMLEKNGISVIQLLQRQRKESSCTKTSELWYPSPPFWKFFKKLPTYSTILQNSFSIHLYVTRQSAQFLQVS